MEFSKPGTKEGEQRYCQVFGMGKTMIAYGKDRCNPDNGNNGELQRRQLSGVHSLGRGDSWW